MAFKYLLQIAAVAALWVLPSLAFGALPIDRISATPIVAGNTSSFSLHDGKLYGWGFDWDGRLGTGLPRAYERDSPTPVAGLPRIKAVATGYGHTLALSQTGAVWAFGDNSCGQIGDNSTTFAAVPKLVAGLTSIVQIAAGPGTSYAVNATGRVYAWGCNEDGELGLGSTVTVKRPQRLTTPTSIVGLAAGAFHALAVDSAGKVWAWGYNGYGQLGDGTWSSRTTPFKLTGISNVTQVSAGRSHSLARDQSGHVWAWGRDIQGQLGNDPVWADYNVPLLLNTISGVSAVAAGEDFSLALKASGEVWSWGLNSDGQLGDGTTITRFTPVKTLVRDTAARIAAGQQHAFAVDVNGELFGWGANPDGRLGNGTSDYTPVAPSRMLFAYAYKVLVLLVSAGQTDYSAAQPTIDRLAYDFERESYGKVTVAVDYAGPYVTTSQTLGCTGDAVADQLKIRDYAAARATAAGIDLSRYAHFISWPSADLYPGCLPSTANGGTGWNTPATSGAGITVLAAGWGGYTPNIIMHEFTHAFAHFVPHVDQLACTGSTAYVPYSGPAFVNPACIYDSTPQELDPMGDHSLINANWADTTDVFNETASYKSYFGWLAPADVKTIPTAPATYTVDLTPSDLPDAPTSYAAAKVPLSAPFLSTQSYWLEYRVNAALGLPPNFANVPGVYLYLNDADNQGSPYAFLLKVGNDANNINGLTPLAVNASVPLTAKVSVKVLSVNGTTAQLSFTVLP